MTNRERALNLLHYKPVDRLPAVHFGYWHELLVEWAEQGHIPMELVNRHGDSNDADRELDRILGWDFNWQHLVGAYMGLNPCFEHKILDTFPDGTLRVQNSVGLIEKVKPGVTSIPSEDDYLCKDREAFETLYRPKMQFDPARIKRVVQIQENIFGYHAGLGSDTHYFRSPWYQWPIIWWPMWYFSGTGYMPDGMISSISCMGNPAVWWFGLVALIFVLVRMCWVRRAPKSYVMVIIGFASQFLPWVLVPRSTFIYHYFASVPFIIIASVLMLNFIRSRSENAFKVTSTVLLCAALVLFIMFYPLESGMPVARTYAQCLRWFKWYNF